MLIVDSVQVWREADGDYCVEWQTSAGDVAIEVEPLTGVPAGAAGQTPGRARFSGLPRDRRHYFRVADGLGNEVEVAERRLALDGSPNFRDFGGYRTADDRRVKWGYLFRSGHLCGLSDPDLALLAHLELDLICDFRREEEQASEPSRLPPGPAPRVVALPIIPGSNRDALQHTEDDPRPGAGMYKFMVSINRAFASEQSPAFAAMFREILELPDARLLIHCAAGKDRTGFAAAMILLALGVPREVVMADYLLSGRFFRPGPELGRVRVKYGLEGLEDAAILPMLEVREDYLQAALGLIDEQYGTIEAYLEQVLGLGAAERAELRGRYTR